MDRLTSRMYLDLSFVWVSSEMNILTSICGTFLFEDHFFFEDHICLFFLLKFSIVDRGAFFTSPSIFQYIWKSSISRGLCVLFCVPIMLGYRVVQLYTRHQPNGGPNPPALVVFAKMVSQHA